MYVNVRRVARLHVCCMKKLWSTQRGWIGRREGRMRGDAKEIENMKYMEYSKI
jgi:hypothetical protein